jgi:UDP-GlcNAc:undecaprenyl-phosphate GlcNAc-1-phosphate transferase
MSIALFVTAALIAAGFIRLLSVKAAHALGLLDVPGGRKKHAHPIPLVGGVGMALAMVILAPWWMTNSSRQVWLLGLLVMAAIAGVLDDRYHLRARTKLVPQILMALAVVFGANLSFENLGELLGDTPVMLGAGATLFTVFAIVGTINTTNMADGLDGLAGGYVAIALLAFLAIAVLGGETAKIPFIATLLGANMGFLAFNMRAPWRSRAAAFMGDSGSMMLGLALAWLGLRFSIGPNPVMPPVLGALIFALPLFDILATLLRRLLGGKNPFRADRRHIHYLLRDTGWTTKQVVSRLHLTSLLIAILGVAGWHWGWSDETLFMLFIGFFMAFLIFVCVMRKACQETRFPAHKTVLHHK